MQARIFETRNYGMQGLEDDEIDDALCLVAVSMELM